MLSSPFRRLEARSWWAVTAITLVVLLASPRGALADEMKTYIVELSAAPLATYDGGIAGLPATSSAETGGELDTDDPDSRRYKGHLEDLRRRVLEPVSGSPDVFYRYSVATAGFAARMTREQARELERVPGVLRVTRDRRVRLAANPIAQPASVLGSEPPNFLGLPDRLWRRLGGPNRAGAGVVVGVIDGGIHPENPSFADVPVRGGQRLYWGSAYEPARSFRGTCQAGEGFPASTCNNKLIGARYFVEGFGVENVSPLDYLSPRDVDGHGSHTASTAAGNFGVDPSVFGNDLGVDLISGIAPRAYISHYKAFWLASDAAEGEGTSSDLVAAIDKAVADGVDVINASFGTDFSQGGPTPEGLAFLRAVKAGVFVAQSAGNEGPGPETVIDSADAPWITGVGASTVARTFASRATLRDRSGAPPPPLRVQGVSQTNALAEVGLVDGAQVPAAGFTSEEAGQCEPGALRRSAVKGKAVLCSTGGTTFETEKSKEVLRLGGKGVIVYFHDPALDPQLTDGTTRGWVPTVELVHADGLAVKDFIAAAQHPTVRLSAAEVSPIEGDVVTEFSSRGPQGGVPDILKPDVVAPGANILAAFSPVQADGFYPPGDIFHVWQGTSMASPHVAGAGALLSQLHPGWTPSEIKSALITTAVPRVTDREGRRADPFEAGAGRIDPNVAANPGLLLDETVGRYRRYSEGVDPESIPGSPPPLDPGQLNMPSIAISNLLGSASATRTFESADDARTDWSVGFRGLTGVAATAEPTAFGLAPGRSRSVRFRFSRTGAPVDEWVFGTIVLTERGGDRRLRMPVAIRPVALSAPSEIDVDATGAQGSEPLQVRTGYEGVLSARGFGLATPNLFTGETIQTTTGSPNLEGDAGSRLYPVSVPPGSNAIAGDTSNVDGGDPSSDLDLYLYHDDEGDGFDDGDLVDLSASFDATETITLVDPEAGDYLWVVVGFTTAEPSSVYDFTNWLLDDPSPDDPANAPGLRVSGDPATAQPGGTVQLSLDWSGVSDPGRYLGAVTYHDSAAPNAANVIGRSLLWLNR